jgi:hypothetical protein
MSLGTVELLDVVAYLVHLQVRHGKYYVMLFCVKFSDVVSCCVMLCCVIISSHAVLCHIELFYLMLVYVVLYRVMLNSVM